MSNFKNIQDKLQDFIVKYYTNEILKGSILFLSLGLLYFIFILFIEYFLWLNPAARTVLFWLFLLVELILFSKFILLPIFKLVGLKKGLSPDNASKIIGNHFNEIDDRLLNLLQLNNIEKHNELLLASIEQKSKKLQPIPFKNAINFRSNFKYLKYLVIPIIIWAGVFISGNISIFQDSFARVVNHNLAYLPPAPFEFHLLNSNLTLIEDSPFILRVTTKGNVKPEDIKINFDGESYFLNSRNFDEYYYEFDQLNKSVEFYFEADGIQSEKFKLEVVRAPKIINFEMKLQYPKYVSKTEEVVRNTGNAVVPEGTKIVWKISSRNTDKVVFTTLKEGNSRIVRNTRETLSSNSDGIYNHDKYISKSINYQITTSNENIKKYETLHYELKVTKDQFPKIIVRSDIDSVSRGRIQFIGQISDDYGISLVQVVARNMKDGLLNISNIESGRSNFEEFFYSFPDGIDLEEGNNYEIYFEVFDNDMINGFKRTKSKIFNYRNKTADEIESELLREQKEGVENLENSSYESKELQRDLEKFSDKLKSKSKSDWNDEKELEKFVQRQKNYDEMFRRNAEKLLDNLEEMEETTNPNMEEKKEELKKRIEETKDIENRQRLLKELEELTEKLKKENLLDKTNRLQEQTKQKERSLERILELTKRFYVQKKTDQIIRKLDELSNEQNELSESKENGPEKQNELNKKFDSIQKDFDDLDELNRDLKSPVDMPDTDEDQKKIEEEMEKAEENLKWKNEESSKQKSHKSKMSKNNQKSASKKLQELSKKIEASMMQMEMEGSEENIKDLQQILENLIIFSFDQESLMLSFEGISSKNAEYPSKLKYQQTLKEHFEHIDDSLYTLSLRMVRLSTKINTYLSEVNYNLNRSLELIAENNIQNGVTHQHYTMTAANNLADMLSSILSSLQNKKPGNGGGKGKEGESIELPDIIKQQQNLIGKMKDGLKPGKSQSGKSQEQMSGEQFQIYKEQKKIKDQLNSLLKANKIDGGEAQNALHQMEELEKLLLEKGLTNDILNSMEKLNHELLKLEEGTYSQNKDEERRAETGETRSNSKEIYSKSSKRIYFNRDEILIRNTLPLESNFQNKVMRYFDNDEPKDQ